MSLVQGKIHKPFYTWLVSVHRKKKPEKITIEFWGRYCLSVRTTHNTWWPKVGNAPYRHQIPNVHGQRVIHLLICKEICKDWLAPLQQFQVYLPWVRRFDIVPWGQSWRIKTLWMLCPNTIGVYKVKWESWGISGKFDICWNFVLKKKQARA